MITKSKLYVHWVDDVFIVTHYYKEINKFKETLEKNQKNSDLNFTAKLNINKKKSLSLINLQTPLIITNSLHLYIKKTLHSYHTIFYKELINIKKKTFVNIISQ